jgi:hypothetical protein
MQLGPLLFGPLTGRRIHADLREQPLNEHVVDHPVIEGVAVRLVLQQRFSFDAEDLSPMPEPAGRNRSSPMWLVPFETRTMASCTPGLA